MQAVLPEVLVAVASPWLACWLCLLMQPAKLPFDKSLLILANYMHKVCVIDREYFVQYRVMKSYAILVINLILMKSDSDLQQQNH